MPLYLSNPVLTLYFLLSLIISAFCFLAIRTKSKKIDNINAFFVFLLMVFFYGTRYPGTIDTQMYLGYFDGLTNFESFPWGIGFYQLMLSIKTIWNSHESYVFYSSLYLMVLLFIVVFLLLSKTYYKSLCLLSFFYSWSFLDLMTNTYRQGITVPFVILYVYFLLRGNLLFSLIMAGIALSLHWSAILIIIIVTIGWLIRNRINLLKAMTAIALLVFTLSFFVNANLADFLARGPLMQQVQGLFVGVNFASKVNAYLGSGIDGANFYDMAGYQRIYYSAEIYIATLIIGFYFIRYSHELKDDKKFMTLFSAFLLISIYGVLLISMTWFIRNFYWGVPLSQVLYMYILKREEERGIKGKYLTFGYILFIISLGTATMWRVPLLTGSYPGF
ncbi:EpsG family protein [Pectobacterium aroidearum]|uniref:EpsG family protein n=1 Tax=Pectobacterium aroidearum TaxID=1201031 RepID=UPI0015F61C32|nr:EpsG family protein [Pectobacterium aroidearum]MBA5599878.1 EpsG family protein [Pectobacterium aroidearum]